jgi:hypothetical protein
MKYLFYLPICLLLVSCLNQQSERDRIQNEFETNLKAKQTRINALETELKLLEKRSFYREEENETVPYVHVNKKIHVGDTFSALISLSKLYPESPPNELKIEPNNSFDYRFEKSIYHAACDIWEYKTVVNKRGKTVLRGTFIVNEMEGIRHYPFSHKLNVR